MNNKIKIRAKELISRSYSPYSHFRVAAVIQCADGSLFDGVNVENASYSLTMCAERSAVFNAVSHGCRDIESIFIYSDSSSMPYPCGACLGVLSEFNNDMKVIIASNSKEEQFTLSELLPRQFSL
ncbi:MAG: cytidine deaminase [candidate division WOR-3 bacterium]|nr:cytidine deaminase [candidate division WOR-3 bacterium]